MTQSDKALRRPMKRSRCAIYTRKSTDEGLDQAFTSLDAQREACASFIQSQKHEGWIVLPNLYDDGGYSGGTMERPALKRLLADIEAGLIDVVVVYKVDRLTRALSDFAKLVEIFDRRSISFVSITQQFNTTTSMGRLTLNILLSFAQFERELIGERVRDKVLASKKKGMWMGGTVPLGYDVKDRKLVVNACEARTVVDVFRRYLRLKSVRALGDELFAAGIRSKRRIRPDGTQSGQQRIGQGSLYLMLQNRTYRGEATHKGNAYPGEHSAIVDKKLWDAVQATLADNRVARATGVGTKEPSLLTGIVFDETDERLTPSWTIKKGTRYRYYVSTSLVTGVAKRQSTRRRIPAGNLEAVVIDRLRAFLTDRAEVLDAVGDELAENVRPRQLIDRAQQIADDAKEPEKIKAVLMALVSRIEVRPDSVKIAVSQKRLDELLAAPSIDLTLKHREPINPSDQVVTLRAPMRLKRVGRELKLVADNSENATAIDQSLLKVVARAHDIQKRLSENAKLTVHDVARAERLSAGYLYALLRLPWLAPDITTAIVNGQQPITLNAMKLMRLTAHLPADWAEQRALLGFR